MTFDRVRCWPILVLIVAVLVFGLSSGATAAPPAAIPVVKIPNSEAKTEKEMQPYTDLIVGADVKFEMVPIPGGKFTMGSPASEAGRKENEGPQHEVTIEPFWMGKHEVRWEEYEEYMIKMNARR